MMGPTDQTVPTRDVEVYYDANGARDFYRLSRMGLLTAAYGSGLSAFFKSGEPLKGPKPLVSIVLGAAGIPYQIVKGAVMPPDDA